MSPLRHRFQSYEFGDLDIHVRTLRDRQQFDESSDIASIPGLSSASWPLFGVVWESSLVLAELMQTFDINKRRILEVGCGIGMASLMLSSRKAEITATDQHPLAGTFLNYNADLNGFDRISFVQADWAPDTRVLGTFDVIIGSDLLYEQDNVALLSAFIHNRTNPQCEIIMTDPGRGLTARFKERMSLLGYALDLDTKQQQSADGHSKIHVMRFRRFGVTESG